MRNTIFVYLITYCQFQLVWCVLDTWKKKNVFRCTREQLDNLITSINWTLGIGLSVKRLNDKSPFSLFPFFSWALCRVLCPDPQHNLRPYFQLYSQANIFGFMPAWTSPLNWL